MIDEIEILQSYLQVDYKMEKKEAEQVLVFLLGTGKRDWKVDIRYSYWLWASFYKIYHKPSLDEESHVILLVKTREKWILCDGEMAHPI